MLKIRICRKWTYLTTIILSVILPRSVSNYYNISDAIYPNKASNFTQCNNATTNLSLLNDKQGQYGRCIDVTSAHAFLSYGVYFCLCFVIIPSVEENACLASNASYYLSLVAVNKGGKTMDLNQGQVIWTANPEKPVTKNSCLQLGDDSNLKLVDYHDNSGSSDVVWETKTTDQAINASLAFTFEGNLILFGYDPRTPYALPFAPLWQSHQHPTDTLMVLQVLPKWRTLNVSNSADSRPPKSGNYTMVIENCCLVLYARIGQYGEETPYGYPYWVWSNSSSAIATGACASAEEGISFVALCWDSENKLQLNAGYNRSQDAAEVSPTNCSSMHQSGNLQSIIKIEETNASKNATYATFVRLEADGDLRAYTVNDTTYPGSLSVWTSFYSLFQDKPCQLPLYCGFYGKWDQQNKDNHCTCDTGFELNDPSNVRLGCKLRNAANQQLQLPINGTVSAIGKDQDIDFISLQDVHYFSINFTDLHGHDQSNDISSKESRNTSCQEKCRRDCNCTAAFWNRSASTCFLVRGPVGTIQNGTMVAYLKYIRPTRKSTQHRFVIGSLLAATMAAFLLACIYFYYRRRALRIRSAELEEESLLLSLLGSDSPSRFTWKQMHEYTCGFSDVLGGGGFGSVSRGSLPDGTAVAVKQLDADVSYGQGNKEFLAEVSILGRIHHAYLVRLIGFCLEGTHRLLVYEFMENGSLDSWLFRGPVITKKKSKNEALYWRTRFQIALGISKGLAYLHEECEDRIIHMDFKPQNILLGRDFIPKISDFGMSRRVDREKSSVMTVMRGTPGYLAPEWLLDCAITEKCDVYSFGIVLLEMMSGRKVRDLQELKQKLRMRSLKESVMLELLDDKLKHYDGSDVREEEAVRMVEIALLCVRRDPEKRPAMSTVALMLEGKVAVELQTMDEGEEELVMYPSSLNKTMRSMGRLTTSFGDDSYGKNLMLSTSYSYDIGSSSHSSTKKKKSMPTSSSYMEIDHGVEADALFSSIYIN